MKGGGLGVVRNVQNLETTMCEVKSDCKQEKAATFRGKHLGTVVQSIVRLTRSLLSVLWFYTKYPDMSF